jgi:hypothetical protein
MAHGVEQGVFIGFDQPDAGVIQVCGDPFGFDKVFGTGI